MRTNFALTIKDGLVTSILMIASLWLLAHPYLGVRCCDAQLYAVQALSHLYPEIYLKDIFFAYGSQDSYTLFSPLYARLIAWVGLEEASRTIVAISCTVWLYGAWRVSAILSERQRWVFLALLVALPGYYASNILSYGLASATPRTIAEALTLVALGTMLSGGWIRSLVWLLAAASLHPLMAFGGIVLYAVWQALAMPRAIVLGGIVAGGVVLTILASSGFLQPIFASADPLWFDLIHSRSHVIFMTLWRLQSWNLIVLSLALLATAWHRAHAGEAKRLFLSALLLASVMLAIQLIGVDWWHSRLLMQVQPYRALWLVKWLAVAAFVYLLPQDQDRRILLPLLFAAAWFAQDTVGGFIALIALWFALAKHTEPSQPRLLWLLLIAAVASWLFVRMQGYAELYDRSWQRSDIFAESLDIGKSQLVVLLFAARDMVVPFGALSAWCLHSMWQAEGSPSSLLKSPLVALYVVAIVGFAVFFFGVQSANWQMFFAAPDPAAIPHAISNRIPANASVYWLGKPEQTWFALGRRNYYSLWQSAGVVFTRDGAVEMKRRADVLAQYLGGIDSQWEFDAPESDLLPAREIRRNLPLLCGAEEIDFIILKLGFSDLQEAEWVDRLTKARWHLYDCRRIAREAYGSKQQE